MPSTNTPELKERSLRSGGNGFGERGEGIGFVKEVLTLKIRGLDKIAVDNAQFSDASADQEISGGATDRAASDDDGAGGEQALLPSSPIAAKSIGASIFR